MGVNKEALDFTSRIELLYRNFGETTALFRMAQACFEENVADSLRNSRHDWAYIIIRRALFRSLILELASLNFDDSRMNINPSIRALIRQLGDATEEPNTKLLNWLRDRYVSVAKGPGMGLRNQFDAYVREALAAWASVRNTAPWVALWCLRP
jgi:AbiU2